MKEYLGNVLYIKDYLEVQRDEILKNQQIEKEKEELLKIQEQQQLLNEKEKEKIENDNFDRSKSFTIKGKLV